MDHSRVPVLEALEAFRRRGPAPGERITREVLDHLISGIEAGMLIPDTADSSLASLHCVAE